jgi:hypothetical protein
MAIAHEVGGHQRRQRLGTTMEPRRANVRDFLNEMMAEEGEAERISLQVGEELRARGMRNVPTPGSAAIYFRAANDAMREFVRENPRAGLEAVRRQGVLAGEAALQRAWPNFITSTNRNTYRAFYLEVWRRESAFPPNSGDPVASRHAAVHPAAAPGAATSGHRARYPDAPEHPPAASSRQTRILGRRRQPGPRASTRAGKRRISPHRRELRAGWLNEH